MRHKQIVLATLSICEINDRGKIDEIAGAANQINGISLINVAPNPDQARTIIAFTGNIEQVMDAVLLMAKKSFNLLKIKNKSPRIGVMDTVFFTPIQGCGMDDCKKMAKKIGKMIYQEFQVPFFYHNYKNFSTYLEFVSALTQKGIQGLRSKIKSGYLKPTLGNLELGKNSGFLFAFARKPAIRFLINISTFDPDISFRIAQRLDCQSHAKIWASGTTVEGEQEQIFIIPEKFDGIKALGVSDEYLKNQQINILIHNLEKAALHEVYETVKYEVEYFGAEILFCEIHGFLSKQPLIKSGKFYAKEELSDEELIDLAVRKMQLSEGSEFVPEVKIIEYIVEGKW